jgi:hypothetical protein
MNSASLLLAYYYILQNEFSFSYGFSPHKIRVALINDIPTSFNSLQPSALSQRPEIILSGLSCQNNPQSGTFPLAQEARVCQYQILKHRSV